jgi:flagellar hook-associated protein 1 FlgK
MSAGALFSLGQRAMAASYAQLQTTSNNISNVNTKGYSRQEVELATAGGVFKGAGFFGRGVDVVSVKRAHDEFLNREAAISSSISQADSARSMQLQQLEKVFGIGESGIGRAANDFFNAYADVASRPQDLPARQVVLARAGELASRFNTAAGQIDNLQAGVTIDLKTSVAQVNDLTSRIAQLNEKISGQRGTGQPPNDLLDQRDTAIRDLSKLLQVTTIPSDDGALGVFMGGGQALVLGSSTIDLVAMPDSYDSSKVSIGIAAAGGSQQIPDSLFIGGSITGLLRFQGGDIPDARNLLGQMALGIGLQVNEQQSKGVDLLGQTGASMFRFASASGLPTLPALASSLNGGSASVSLTLQSPSSLTAASVSSVQAADYRITADGSGGFSMQRLKGGAPDPQYSAVSVANSSVVDGFLISISGTASAGDTFLLQPAGGAAREMRLEMSNPKLIAAATPISATLGIANAGTGSVGLLSVDGAAVGTNPNLPATLRFQTTATPGQFTYTWTDGTGTSTAATWVPGQPIDYPGTTATNGFSVRIDGVPVASSTTPAVASDTFVFAANPYAASDNRNANALLALRDNPLVGAVWSGGSLQAGVTATDAYANILADIGVRVQSAKSAADVSADVANDAEANRAGKSEVNLDEEAARLIQYQQSYQAAAKMLQVAQSIFDTLLRTAG